MSSPSSPAAAAAAARRANTPAFGRFLDVPPGRTRTIETSPLLEAKKPPIGSSSDDENENGKDASMMSALRKSPGAVLVLPFVLLFGLDLVANIAVLTKRSLEVAFTGEYTVWTPWQ